METSLHGGESGLPRVFTTYARSASVSGRRYKVELNLDTGLGRCECAGFLYRDACRHVEEARSDMINRSYSMRLAAALSGTGLGPHDDPGGGHAPAKIVF